MSVVKTNDLNPSEPGRAGLWLRLRRWAGAIAWGAYRGDNPGILIAAMLILIAIFAYLLRDGVVGATIGPEEADKFTEDALVAMMQRQQFEEMAAAEADHVGR